MQLVTWEGSRIVQNSSFVIEHIGREARQDTVVISGDRIPDEDRLSGCKIYLTRAELSEILATCLLNEA